MFQEQDYDEDRLRAETILFWGNVGPQTGLAVVLADTPADLVEWFRERARVEGASSWLSRALLSVEAVARRVGDDPEVGADAIGSMLEEEGIPFLACGPLLREILGNRNVRERLWDEGSLAIVPGFDDDVEDLTDEAEKGYMLEQEGEDMAEHSSIDFGRVDHRVYLVQRLEALKTPPEKRRAG